MMEAKTLECLLKSRMREHRMSCTIKNLLTFIWFSFILIHGKSKALGGSQYKLLQITLSEFNCHRYTSYNKYIFHISNSAAQKWKKTPVKINLDTLLQEMFLLQAMLNLPILLFVLGGRSP